LVCALQVHGWLGYGNFGAILKHRNQDEWQSVLAKQSDSNRQVACAFFEAVEVLFASSTTEALIGIPTSLDQENA
jgi:glycyl-tRNA synthetase (class II)